MRTMPSTLFSPMQCLGIALVFILCAFFGDTHAYQQERKQQRPMPRRECVCVATGGRRSCRL